ncbi:hypothetical protein C2G38_2036498 [Gigaspora rosea]|uniref:SWIM-type domain-containing protein n=1 Tax=Gigaspora rosea TaxID=44941 RepID=A0A397V920_9GLOM|nr:hypothetical protein C2G38_2036498 [Gigaspora rosea]
MRCIQVPLTEVPSVIDLYTFDTVSSGGGSLSEGYTILSQDCTNNSRLRKGDIKSITLIDKDTKYLSNSTLVYVEYLKCSARNGCRKGKCNWKGCIAVFKDKPLNLCDIECRGNHDPDHDRKKPYRMAKVIRKKSQVDLQTQCHQCWQQVSSLMDTYEAEGVAISNQYSIKNAQDPKEQAVLLGIASTIMLTLLTKYSDLLAQLKKYFPNTQAILYDWHEADALKEWFTKNLNDQWLRDRIFYQFRFIKRSRDQEEFDERKVNILDAEKLQAAIGIMKLDTVRVITSYFRTHWFGDWHAAAELDDDDVQHAAAELDDDDDVQNARRYTKSLHANLEKIRMSMRINAREIERFWQGEGKPPTKLKLQREKEKIIKQCESLYQKNRIQDDDDVQHAAAKLDNDDVQHAAAELDDNDDVQNVVAELDDYEVSKESSRLSESRKIKTPETNDDYFIKQHRKILCITRKNGKFACPCSFNVICGHDCQNIAAVRFFINEFEAQKFVPESTSNTFLESYIHQKNTNGHSKDELKLPQKRGPKNKRKSRLVPGESIQLRYLTLYEPYHKVQIVEIIGDGEVIVDFILENGDKDQCIVQLANIIGYDDEQLKKKSKTQVLHQSAFTHYNIHKQANDLALANPNSQTHLLLQVLDRMKNKQWSEAKILWTESLPSYMKLWKEPYIIPCGSEFKTKNGEKPKNIPMNAFRYLYICSGRAILTRQIDQQLSLILAINVMEISINKREYVSRIKTFRRKLVFL